MCLFDVIMTVMIEGATEAKNLFLAAHILVLYILQLLWYTLSEALMELLPKLSLYAFWYCGTWYLRHRVLLHLRIHILVHC